MGTSKNGNWPVRHLNIAILATDGKTFRKLAWITTRSGGIYCGIGSTIGVTTKLSYHTNGDVYQGMISKNPTIVTKPRTKLTMPPITDVKGLVPFYGAGLGWHDYFPAFPFEKIDDAVYVDIRDTGGLSFNLGLLQPYAYEALKGLGLQRRHTHVHIINRTEPWIVIWTY